MILDPWPIGVEVSGIPRRDYCAFRTKDSHSLWSCRLQHLFGGRKFLPLFVDRQQARRFQKAMGLTKQVIVDVSYDSIIAAARGRDAPEFAGIWGFFVVKGSGVKRSGCRK